jgi:hypothetical protein
MPIIHTCIINVVIMNIKFGPEKVFFEITICGIFFRQVHTLSPHQAVHSQVVVYQSVENPSVFPH